MTVSNLPLIVQTGLAVLKRDHPSWTIERLLCDPPKAIHFCKNVRAKLGVCNAADTDILWAMLNGRKSGLFTDAAGRGRKGKR